MAGVLVSELYSQTCAVKAILFRSFESRQRSAYASAIFCSAIHFGEHRSPCCALAQAIDQREERFDTAGHCALAIADHVALWTDETGAVQLRREARVHDDDSICVGAGERHRTGL